MSLQQHILHNIAGIDSPRDRAIQASLHHPPQRVAMPLEQIIDR